MDVIWPTLDGHICSAASHQQDCSITKPGGETNSLGWSFFTRISLLVMMIFQEALDSYWFLNPDHTVRNRAVTNVLGKTTSPSNLHWLLAIKNTGPEQETNMDHTLLQLGSEGSTALWSQSILYFREGVWCLDEGYEALCTWKCKENNNKHSLFSPGVWQRSYPHILQLHRKQ